MNKLFISLGLISQVLFTQAAPTNPFEKLTPKIYAHAIEWSEKATQLDGDSALVYLNLFALNTEETAPAFIKCAEYIQSQKDTLALFEELGISIMETIKTYAENVEKKIALKNNLTDEEKETLWQKLAIKIEELISHINAIYYQTLYNAVVKKDVKPMYIFNENGLIAPENRTQALPMIS